MKSILVVIPNLRGGGAERVHIDLANEWVKLGYTVSFCLTQEGGCLKDQLHESIKII